MVRSFTAHCLDKSRLIPLLDDAIRQGLPGIVLGVKIPGEDPWLAAAGKADIETGEPLRPDHLFRFGSITKTFTSALVLQLMEEGRLTLDDFVETYLPGIIPQAKRIRIRRLLNMTSGLYDPIGSGEMIPLLQKNPKRKWKPEELIQIANRHSLNFAPGTKYEYSNTNYILLGMIIECITGQVPGYEMKHRFCRPLGLDHTYFGLDSSFPNAYAHGYVKADGDDRWRDFSRYDTSSLFTAGDGVGAAADLLRWAEALYGNRVLSLTTMQKIFQYNSVPEKAQPGLRPYYGLGVLRFDYGPPLSDISYSIIGHNGATTGYSSWMQFQPDHGIGVVALCNLDESLVGHKLDNFCLQVFNRLLSPQALLS